MLHRVWILEVHGAASWGTNKTVRRHSLATTRLGERLLWREDDGEKPRDAESQPCSDALLPLPPQDSGTVNLAPSQTLRRRTATGRSVCCGLLPFSPMWITRCILVLFG